MKDNKEQQSAAARALEAAGDQEQAKDVGDIDKAMAATQKKLNIQKSSLVQRLIFGPRPDVSEYLCGIHSLRTASTQTADEILTQALDCLQKGEAFTADGSLSKQLRKVVAENKAYGFTIPAEYQGLGLNYNQFAILEEGLAANGLGGMAVELSGQLTIGGGSLLGYGNVKQKSTFLPLLAEGRLTGFALTEVGIGVNAKKIQAYVEKDEEHQCWRLFAKGASNKYLITNAVHSGLLGVVARIGKGGEKIGLFVTEVPKENIDGESTFTCIPSGTSAFHQVYNSRLEFDNFPIPFENQIEGDGVEILFYCLRMGRCMLAAMCAGYQKMMASDSANYARQRLGVGGLLLKHELPRQNIAKILGGALLSQALSHLSLSQDSQGVDLAGLRDITKSAAASSLLSSLIATERVIGGRSMDKSSRITAARTNIHAFGIVEGEDDLIRLGMIKDITAAFTDKYMANMLGVLQSMNVKDGKVVPEKDRILKISYRNFLKSPLKIITAKVKLLSSPSIWFLFGWVLKNGSQDIFQFFGRLIPIGFKSRYGSFPSQLKEYIYFTERELSKCKWTYFGLSLFYQLEQTKAQIPLLKLGKKIEHLVSILVICSHASKQDRSSQNIAAFYAEYLKSEMSGSRIILALASTEKLRRHLAKVAKDIENNECSLIQNIQPQPFAHDWNNDESLDSKKSESLQKNNQ